MEKVKCYTCDNLLFRDESCTYEEYNLTVRYQCKRCNSVATAHRITHLSFDDQIKFNIFLEEENSLPKLEISHRTSVYYDGHLRK